MPSVDKNARRLTPLATVVAVVFVVVVILAAVLIWSFSSGRVVQRGAHETVALEAEEFEVNLTLPGSLDETGGVMLARLQVPESQLSNLYAGKQVIVTIPELDDYQVYGTVSHISDEAQPLQQADAAEGAALASGEACYEATVTLGVNPEKATDGMEVFATVWVEELGEAFGIAPEALGKDAEGTFVSVVQSDGAIKQYPVTVIGTNDDGRIIVQGASLSSGLSICTDIS